MASAKIYFQMDVALPGGSVKSIGDKSSPVIVTLDSTAPDYFNDVVYISNNAEATVLTISSTGDLAAFKILALKPTVTMYVGFSGSGSEEATLASSVFEMRANTWNLITGDSTTAYNETLLTRVDNATTAHDIKTVVVGNRSGSDGSVEIVAVN